MTEPTPPGELEPLTELLILPDGTIYTHNLTAEVARILSALDPGDATMRQRAAPEASTRTLPIPQAQAAP